MAFLSNGSFEREYRILPPSDWSFSFYKDSSNKFVFDPFKKEVFLNAIDSLKRKFSFKRQFLETKEKTFDYIFSLLSLNEEEIFEKKEVEVGIKPLSETYGLEFEKNELPYENVLNPDYSSNSMDYLKHLDVNDLSGVLNWISSFSFRFDNESSRLYSYYNEKGELIQKRIINKGYSEDFYEKFKEIIDAEEIDYKNSLIPVNNKKFDLNGEYSIDFSDKEGSARKIVYYFYLILTGKKSFSSFLDTGDNLHLETPMYINKLISTWKNNAN